jgi:hypothetical protein
MPIPSYDPNDLISDAKRWRELAARTASPKREEYMGLAEKCEDLVSRSIHVSVLKDELCPTSDP